MGRITSVMALLLVVVLLARPAVAETTFFDDPGGASFIAGSPSVAAITGGVGGLGTGGGCIYKWNCTEWGACLPSGRQARNCTNVGSCAVPGYVRVDEQGCAYSAPAAGGEEAAAEPGAPLANATAGNATEEQAAEAPPAASEASWWREGLRQKLAVVGIVAAVAVAWYVLYRGREPEPRRPVSNKPTEHEKMIIMAGSTDVSLEVKRKAAKLFAGGRVRKQMDTDRRAYFEVRGETEKHSVVFDKTRNAWSCDCKFSSMMDRECSHIAACKMSEKNPKA